jgi:hypothetical protein
MEGNLYATYSTYSIWIQHTGPPTEAQLETWYSYSCLDITVCPSYMAWVYLRHCCEYTHTKLQYEGQNLREE